MPPRIRRVRRPATARGSASAGRRIPDVRLGLIVRDVRTGLGHQTLEIAAHLKPAVIVVVAVTARRPLRPAGFYPDAETIAWQAGGSLTAAYGPLATCDAVLSAETFYDRRLPEILTAAGVPTALIVNPELYSGDATTEVWAPTSWLLRPEWRLVEHPAPVHRYPTVGRLREPLTVVHPSSTAMLDRNGTDVARRAARLGHFPQTIAGPLGQTFGDYWERDPGMAASLLPRRYGGLCLPALEAFAAGTPVLMPPVSPNVDWPIVPLRYLAGGEAAMKGGRISLVDFRPDWVARDVVAWLSDRDRIEEQRLTVRAWAESKSWDALLPVWTAALRRLASTAV